MRQSRATSTVLFLLLFALLIYTSYRAYALSLTHDESVSFLWFQHIDVLSCFFEKGCWPTANNHLLNTWAWQQSVHLLGISEWAIRLPNVLSHLLYLLCSLALVRSVTRQFWISLAGFALLNFNPYLLDFFSLARGYGLGMGLCMASIYAFFTYLRHERWPPLLAAYGLAALAVLSNFVMFNFLASLWATVFVISLLEKGRGPVRISFNWRQQLKMNAIPLGISTILGLLLYWPLRYLQEGSEFKYGAEQFWMTFQSVVRDSLYNNNYFSKDTLLIFSILYGVFIIFALAGAFWFFFRKPEESWRRLYLASALLFGMSCLVMITQHYLLGSNYLEDRKALVFLPLSGLLFFFLLYGLAQHLSQGPMVHFAAGFSALLLGFHLGRSANLHHCMEWRYDQSTREMVEYLDKHVPSGRAPATLGAYWMFQPTATFYHQVRGIQSFEAPPFIGGDALASGPDFFYVFEGQRTQLGDQYVVERKFKGGTVLLRRKDGAVKK